MNNNQPRRDFARRAQCASDGISEQSASEPRTLPRAVNRQPPKCYGRDEFWHISAHRSDCFRCKNLPHAQGVIASNLKRSAGADDICSAGRQLHIIPGTLPQPAVEDGFARVERRMVVRFRQQDRRTKGRDVSQFAKAIWLALGVLCQRFPQASQRCPSSP